MKSLPPNEDERSKSPPQRGQGTAAPGGELAAEVELHDLDDTQTISIKEIDNLKTLTENRFIELASGDIVDHIENHHRQQELSQLGTALGTYYRDLIFALIQIRLPEIDAKRDWKEILRHKYTMSQTLGRNVGIHVATLDYYTNIKKCKLNPKIIDANEYADTASMAITDELTKAYNRHFFEQEFRRRFQQSRASGVYFSFIMLDLDHFKVYNDKNGHVQGDLALIEAVRILHTVCSWRDIVARWGGEEFAIMLHAQPLAQALKTAEKIREAMHDYPFVNEEVLPGGQLTASLGVTTFRNELRTPLQMIHEADKALYDAKRSGRNCVKSFLDPEQYG
jgi:diguanylate cyclase (GGDEF)-like protein